MHTHTHTHRNSLDKYAHIQSLNLFVCVGVSIKLSQIPHKSAQDLSVQFLKSNRTYIKVIRI